MTSPNRDYHCDFCRAQGVDTLFFNKEQLFSHIKLNHPSLNPRHETTKTQRLRDIRRSTVVKNMD